MFLDCTSDGCQRLRPTHRGAEVTGVFYDSFDPVFENCIQAGAKAANAVLVSRTSV